MDEDLSMGTPVSLRMTGDGGIAGYAVIEVSNLA
jgi:hypothetical protein